MDLNPRKVLITGVLLAFLANTFGPIPSAQADEFLLPKSGSMVHLSPAFSPAVLKGIKLDPQNPFRFHFFVDRGDSSLSQEELKSESAKLIKYFLASLTIPEKDLWVNLSPYEKDRIVPESFGQTEMGRDLLAEDYLLKQITASLIYPESQLGKEFWQKVYAQAQAKFGTTNIPINTFNKVWIVPEKAVVYENGGVAFVLENHLKVMLEQDYLALEKNECRGGSCIRPITGPTQGRPLQNNVNALGSQIVREIVIPALTKEVNEGKNFAQLRQVFYSLILATWYKKKIKDSILNKAYSNQNKVSALSSPPTEAWAQANALIGDPEHIYQQYLQAFKKGVYNYIKEEADPITNEVIPRKYFSGGVEAGKIDLALAVVNRQNVDPVEIAELSSRPLIDIKGDVALTSQTPIQPKDRSMKADGKKLAHPLFVNGKLQAGGIVLVHATKDFPKEGILYPNNYYGDKPLLMRNPRSIVEFSFNGVINLWSDYKVAVLIPLSAVGDAKPVNLWYTDTAYFGPVKIPQGSTILVGDNVPVSRKDKESIEKQGIHIQRFDRGVRDAAADLLQNMGYQPMRLDFSRWSVTTWEKYDPGLDRINLHYANSMIRQEEMFRQLKDIAKEAGIKSVREKGSYPLGRMTDLMEDLHDCLIMGTSPNKPNIPEGGLTGLAKTALRGLSAKQRASVEAGRLLAFADFYDYLDFLNERMGSFLELSDDKEKDPRLYLEWWEERRSASIRSMNEQFGLGLSTDALATKKDYLDALARIAKKIAKKYGVDYAMAGSDGAMNTKASQSSYEEFLPGTLAEPIINRDYYEKYSRMREFFAKNSIAIRKVIYGAAGTDLSNVLAATNAEEIVMITNTYRDLYYWLGKALQSSNVDFNSYLLEKRNLGWAYYETINSPVLVARAIVIELLSLGISPSDVVLKQNGDNECSIEFRKTIDGKDALRQFTFISGDIWSKDIQQRFFGKNYDAYFENASWGEMRSGMSIDHLQIDLDSVNFRDIQAMSHLQFVASWAPALRRDGLFFIDPNSVKLKDIQGMFLKAGHETRVLQTAGNRKAYGSPDKNILIVNSSHKDAAMRTMKPAKTGGIDLNPAQMSMQVKKDGQDFKFDFNGTEIDVAQVTGATFTIRTMTPVTNLPLILGLNQKPADNLDQAQKTLAKV